MQNDANRTTATSRPRRGAIAAALVGLLALSACSSEQVIRSSGTGADVTVDDTRVVTTTGTVDVTTADTTESTKATLPPITGSTVRPTTTPPTTVADGPDTLAAAQQAYFLISAESNSAVQALWGPYPDGVPWTEFPAVCAQAQEIDLKFVADLRAYPDWPAAAVEAIDNLATQNEADAALYGECAATDPADQNALRDIDQRLADQGDARSAAADAVRVALELPLDRG